MSINLIRVVNQQTINRSILLDKIDRSQSNFTGYAAVAKQKIYVPYVNPLDVSVNGYTDLIPTDEVLLSSDSGTIKKLSTAGRVSFMVVSSALVAKSNVTSAANAAGTTTIGGTVFLSVSPDVTYAILQNLSGGTQKIPQAAFTSIITTSIVIPDGAVTIGTPGAGWKVQIQANSKLSNVFTLLKIDSRRIKMRVGIVRTDISRVYLSDVENTSQRDFSAEPAGQSRYFHYPTDAEIAAVLGQFAFVTTRGSNAAATVDTTVANGTKLNIKSSASAAYTQVTVTSSATAAKTQIVSDLNAAFAANGLSLVARISGTNQVTIDSTVGGPNAYISLSAGSPSTAALQTVLGLTVATTTGLTVAATRTAVYPSPTTINVASATILALSTFSLLSTTAQTNLVNGIANLIAPSLVETGPALLSFAYGILSKLRSATFQPGGARVGLPAGVAAAIVANDGSTVFSL